MVEPWRYRAARFSVLALYEVMLMRGNRNLAAGLAKSSVRVSESLESQRVLSKENLIDFQRTLGAPVGSERSRTLGYHSALSSRVGDLKWVHVDPGRDPAS